VAIAGKKKGHKNRQIAVIIGRSTNPDMNPCEITQLATKKA